MEIPSKIYISSKSAEAISKNGYSFSYVSDKPEDYESGAVEYTNLKEKWNDVSNSAPVLKEISVENPVVIYSKEFSKVCYNIYDFAKTADFCFIYGIKNVQWAWLKRLLPRTKKPD